MLAEVGHKDFFTETIFFTTTPDLFKHYSRLIHVDKRITQEMTSLSSRVPLDTKGLWCYFRVCNMYNVDRNVTMRLNRVQK